MNAVAEKVREKVARGQLEKEVQYWERVRSCAKPGATPDPDEISDWLIENEIDPEKWQEDCRIVEERFRAAEGLERAAKLQREADEIEVRHKAELERFVPLIEAHEKLCRELREQRVARENEIMALRGAHSRAFAQCPYQHLIEATQAAAERVGAASRAVARQREFLIQCEMKAGRRGAEFRAVREEAERSLSERRRLLAEAERELAEARAAEDKISKLMREP